MMSASMIQKLLTRIRHVKLEAPLAFVVPVRLTHHCVTARLMLQANFPAQSSKIMNNCFRANLLSSITLKNNQMRCMSATSSDTGSKEHIEKLVKNNKVVVFMKGVPEQPMCGFSNAVTQILRMHGVNYDSHNVLDDDSLRAGIKVYSDWPTIPQVYLNGEFLGGCDIMLQMHQNGDLVEELKTVGIRSALLDQK